MFRNFSFVKNYIMENLISEKNYFDEVYSKLVYLSNEKLGKINADYYFQTVSALGQKFKNRFFFYNFCDNLFDYNGEVNDKFLDFYYDLIESGVALICTSGLNVEAINNNFSQKNLNIIHDFISNIHSLGTKIFLSLKTSYGRIARFKNSEFLISSSFNREYFSAKRFCLPALDSKCNRIAKLFSKMASFANEAEFDGIVIDGTLSNLIGEMTSPEFNRRSFGYFSDIDDMSKKILNNINENVKNMPILYKISPFSFFCDCFSSCKLLSLNGIKTEMKSNKIFDFLSNLVKLGVDGFIFEFGSRENEFLKDFSPYIGEELYGEFYDDLERYFKDIKLKNKFDEDVLLICSDNYYALEKLKGHRMFDITKDLYADQNFLKNIINNRDNRHCLRCGVCRKVAEEKNEVWCAINPEIRYELRKFDVQKDKKIAIVGAGTSGLETAITLARRGYEVEIFEKEDKINKFGRLCEIFGTDVFLKNFNDYLENKVKKFQLNNKIKLNLNNNFAVEDASKFDKIVIATGFKELFLGVPGAVLKSVVSIFDILSQKVDYSDKKHIVIYAKSELSLKLAIILAEKKHNVFVLINSVDFLMNLPQNLLSYYLIASSKLKIKIIVSCQVKNINEDSVELYTNYKTRNIDYVTLISDMRSGKIYKFQPEARVIDCNLFIYDPDLISNNKIFYEIVKSGYKGEMFMVGDALEVSDLCDEIKSAYFVGNNI